MGTLLMFFSFYICAIHASAFHQAENGLAPRPPITTAPPKLDDRDSSTICGYYYNPDSVVHPDDVFCSSDAIIPYTKYYRYGGCPQGGCGIGETCCPSVNPYVVTFIYDNSATYYYSCDSYSHTISAYTQIPMFSVYLTPYIYYTTIDVATSAFTTATPQGVTLSLIPSSTTASPQPVASATSSTTASNALIPSTSSTTASRALKSAAPATSLTTGTTVPQSSSSNNTKLEIGLAASFGAGILIIIVLVASISIVIFLTRRLEQCSDPPEFSAATYRRLIR
ncbi:hypothetical protein V8E54_001999 [Elaphomyces granulatus]